MNKYTFIIKSGKNKNHIIDWVFAKTLKEAETSMEQTLIDCRVLVKAAGYIFGKNYKVRIEKG